jgi:transcriptional regulator with XRE-family HTH domain
MTVPPPLSPRESDETFGQRLRRLRAARGLSQRQLATAGVSYAYISRLEADDRRPSVRAIRLLALALGVTPEYLETGLEIAHTEALELRLADAELRLRLGENPRSAAAALEELLAEASAAAQDDLAARARIAIGLAAFAAGEHAKAAEQLTAAIAARSTTPVAHSSVYLTLAKAHRLAGRPEQAVSTLEEAIVELEEDTTADAGVRIRFAVALSGALSHLGDFSAARSVLREAAAMSDPDPRSQVRLVWSRALLSYRQGRPRSAVRDMRRAIALLDQTEDSVELARAHLFCAEVSLWGSDLELAERHLPLAARLRDLPAETRDLGVLTSCEALLLVRRHEYDEAELCARAALDALREAPADQGIAWTAVALALAGRGDLDSAHDAFANGIAALIASEEYAQAAAVSREWRQQMVNAGHPVAAAEAAERAVETSSRVGLAEHRR